MKTVLITGASRGIGKEIAELFAKDKCRLLLLANHEDELKKVQQELTEKYQISIKILCVDLANKNCLEDIRQGFKEDLSQIDILINNAGFGITKHFEKMNLSEINSLIQVNVTALTELTYLVLPYMLAKKSGMILNVASVAAFCPGPFMSVYYATKAFVHSFSTSLHEEYKNSGITVSTLCPGITKTAFMTQSGLANTSLGDHFILRLMTPDAVAKIAYAGLLKKKRVIIPGLMNKINVFFMWLLPDFLVGKMISYLEKPRQ
jgi:short-subunit dehydrogenase